jgi:hypothetical protein
MSIPGEHKTVHARIIAYAQEIGLRFVPRAEAGARRGFARTASRPRTAPSPKKLDVSYGYPKWVASNPIRV